MPSGHRSGRIGEKMPGETLTEYNTSDSKWRTHIAPLLEDGYRVKIPFSGLSMFPFIEGGRDEVIIVSAQKRIPKRRDICLYIRNDGTHILHRVHHTDGRSLYMLGDAQTYIEGPVDHDHVIAVTEELIRKGKNISCDCVLYRILSELWLILRPFRPFIMKVYLKARALQARFFQKAR